MSRLNDASTERPTIGDDASFDQRFESVLEDLASAGLDAAALAVLAVDTAQLDRELDQLYAGKFPKTCNSCGRIYATREDYLATTRKLRGESTFFDDEVREVQEYRDCPCGSSLLVVVGDRRDDSPWGRRRRRLFDVWLARLTGSAGKSRDALAPVLRRVFRAALARARGEPNDPGGTGPT